MKLFIFLICNLVIPLVAANSSWPQVIESSHLYFQTQPVKASLNLTIHSMKGKPLYELICRTGNYDVTEPFNYSGFLHCGLFSIPLGGSETLFKEEENAREWENRGRFLISHLRRGCAEYKNWGRERHFLVRGIEIVLAIKNEIYSESNQVLQYEFAVQIKNHTETLSSISEKPAEKQPLWFYKDSPCNAQTRVNNVK